MLSKVSRSLKAIAIAGMAAVVVVAQPLQQQLPFTQRLVAGQQMPLQQQLPFTTQPILASGGSMGMGMGYGGVGLGSSYYGSTNLPLQQSLQGSMVGGFENEAITASSPQLSTSGATSGAVSSDLSFQLSGSGEPASLWANAAIGSGGSSGGGSLTGALSGKGPKPIASFHATNQPIMASPNTLAVIELSPIEQSYNVPQTQISQENIKQPITQPVFQPYLQRYVQRAQPILQPVVNRVVQPVVHRQLKPFLTSQTIQGDAFPQQVLPAQYRAFTNAPIVGAEYNAAPMMNMAQPPAVPQVAASVSKA